MIPDFDVATLAEKQMYYYNGSHCIYCNNRTELVDSIEVYQESHGLIYICRGCRAWVGVHHKNTDQAYGTVAKKTLRDLRHQCHLVYDPLWKKKLELTGKSVKYIRGKAYRWLAELLGIDPQESHIGYLNEEQCRIVIEECKKYYKI